MPYWAAAFKIDNDTFETIQLTHRLYYTSRRDNREL